MILFTIMFFYLQGCDGDGRKKTKENVKRKKKSPLVTLSSSFNDMEADCLQMPEEYRKRVEPTVSWKGFLM